MRFLSFFRGLIFLMVFVPGSMYAISANIEIGVSPPRHEFSIGTGQTITREVKVFNNSSTDTYTLQLSSGDCIADPRNGTPICRSYFGSGSDPKSLSSWISFENSGRFTIGPLKEKVVKIIVSAPANALPGGHYGIVYFTPDISGGQDGTVTMVRQIGVLFQVNVPGKLIYDIGFGEIEIETPFFAAPDPIEELWRAPKDKTAWSGALSYLKTEFNPFWNKPELVNSSDFNVKFSIPVSNSGNIDVRPLGRIELYDEDGTLLRKIGKESIKSPEGLFLGEKIVDYLPINDEGGSVLPDGERKRIYTVDWKGFAYETYADGKMVVKFQTPGEYYSAQTAVNAAVLYPWEKLTISVAEKTIKAKIAIEYLGENGKVIPNELERDIIVKYNYIDKTLNMGVILIVVLLGLFAWLIIRRRDDRIDELEEEIEADEKKIKTLEKKKAPAKTTDTYDELEKGLQAAHAALEKKKAPAKKPAVKKVAESDTEAPAVKKPTPKKAPAKKSTPPKTEE